MAITVKHTKVSLIPDGDDASVVRPSDWNADHQLVGTIPVENGGTGASTLTGYVKGNGTAAMTASATVPSTDITGLGTMSTQNANSVSITGGSISGTTVAGYVPTTTTITAGTGLTGGGDLSANRTLSISNTTVTAAAYGSASKTLTATVNAQGQLTALADTNIAITNTQVSGLGTASTKDAGVALGVATLDAAGKVPVTELPDAVLGALSYQGTWNASTNTPTLTSSVGTKGYYYVVSVAGTTNLNGVTDWQIGDWAVYNGTAWQKVDNTDSVTSVNTLTGAVVLTTTNINEGTNLYYTDARARGAVSAGTGISYVSGTGVITNAAPDQTVVLTAGTGISTSGTYPNFTIANTSPSLGGDVVGPTGATDNAVARYDSTTGKLLQNSVVLIGDTGSVTGVNALTAESLVVNNNATLGSSNTDSLDVRARISSDLDPETNNAKDIGSSGRNWRDAFFGRTVHTVNLELTGTTSFDGAQGTAGQVLTSAGTGNTPTWTTPTTGTVTSVTGTSPVVSSGGATPAISLASGYGDTQNPYASKTANFVLAAPNGSAGAPTFRAVVAADIPTLNQNTTGSAATLTTGRTIAITGDLSYTSPSFNGSANVTAAGTLATVNANVGSFTNASVTVNGKGLVTAVSSGTAPVTSVTGTAPVVSSGGATPAISMAAATGSVNGYLTSTDWNTFNNKTSNTGTVTSVGGTGTVNGITLTGTVTTSGNLTLGGTLSGVNLASQVTGTLPIANGGTGATTAANAFNALSPLTTVGDILYEETGAVGARLPIGTTGQVLTVSGGKPAWGAAASSNITALGLWENSATISANYTIGSGNNAQSAGPITISSGVTVTVPSGSTWVVV
jgi:hypothetical protein